MRRTLVSCFAALYLVVPAFGAEWPNGKTFGRLEQIGRGIAVVFTPDLALPGNRELYERLGFTYYETADWRSVLEAIARRNAGSPDDAIHSVILETHGTDGHGLKLQEGKKRSAGRSYVSIGALQERLDAAGVGTVFVSACNAGRLFRPEVYRALDRDAGDPLFLPATLGILDASPDFDPSRASIKVLRRKQNGFETLVHGSTEELSPEARRIVERSEPMRFVVSTMLMQLLLYDGLELTEEGWEVRKSTHDLPREESERLFRRFLKAVERIALVEGE
ncbi:MAG TPA: hypothetical protein VM779_15815 [Thermoanaerobaculia bacterium]|nr:hypothetical protein [Thermoanaerobaculia bacterium]